MNSYFSKEDIQMANKHRKRCSTSLVITGIEIKTTVRHYFTPVRMPIIKKEERKPFFTVTGTIILAATMAKKYVDSSKKLRIELPYDPVLPHLCIYPENTKTLI